jgi:hypothetical protein
VVSGHAYTIPAPPPLWVAGAGLAPMYVSVNGVFIPSTNRAPVPRHRGPADAKAQMTTEPHGPDDQRALHDR